MIHALITAALQITLMLLGVPALLAGAIPVAFYVGRELAQAEHRIIWAEFGNSRALAPWWVGFVQEAWTRKAVMDVVLPVAVVTLICILQGA